MWRALLGAGSIGKEQVVSAHSAIVLVVSEASKAKALAAQRRCKSCTTLQELELFIGVCRNRDPSSVRTILSRIQYVR